MFLEGNRMSLEASPELLIRGCGDRRHLWSLQTGDTREGACLWGGVAGLTCRLLRVQPSLAFGA